MYHPGLDESILILVDQGDDNFLQSVSKQLCDNFHNTIYYRDWPEVIYFSWIVNLGDQGDIGIVDTLDVSCIVKEV
jgi:hypothetical protein